MLCIVKLAQIVLIHLGFLGLWFGEFWLWQMFSGTMRIPSTTVVVFFSFLHHVLLGICNPTEWITSSISSACALLTGILMLFHQLNKMSLCHCSSPITCLTFCRYYVTVIVTHNLMATMHDNRPYSANRRIQFSVAMAKTPPCTQFTMQLATSQHI